MKPQPEMKPTSKGRILAVVKSFINQRDALCSRCLHPFLGQLALKLSAAASSRKLGMFGVKTPRKHRPTSSPSFRTGLGSREDRLAFVSSQKSGNRAMTSFL